MIVTLYLAFSTQSLSKKMLNLTNAYRSEQCMETLKEHRSLVRAAQAQADQMCLFNRFMGKNERELSNNLLRYDYVGQNIGENTAREQGDDYKEVFRIWKEHDSYNKNLLGDFENVGIGTCTSEDGKRYWVQLFGKKLNRNKEAPTSSKTDDRIILLLNASDKNSDNDMPPAVTLDQNFETKPKGKRLKDIDDLISSLTKKKNTSTTSLKDSEISLHIADPISATGENNKSSIDKSISIHIADATSATVENNKSSIDKSISIHIADATSATGENNKPSIDKSISIHIADATSATVEKDRVFTDHTSSKHESDPPNKSQSETESDNTHTVNQKSTTNSVNPSEKSSKAPDIASMINEGFKMLQSSLFYKLNSTSTKTSSLIDTSSLQEAMTDILSFIPTPNKTVAHIASSISSTQITNDLTNSKTEPVNLLSAYTKPFSSFISEITKSISSMVVTTTIFVTSTSSMSNKQGKTQNQFASDVSKLASEISQSNTDKVFDTESILKLKTDELFISKVSSMLYDTVYLTSIKDLCKDRSNCSSFFSQHFLSNTESDDNSKTESSTTTTQSSQDNTSKNVVDIPSISFESESSQDKSQVKSIDASDYGRDTKSIKSQSTEDGDDGTSQSILNCKSNLDKSNDKRHTQLIIADIEGRIINYDGNKISNTVDKRNIKNSKSEQIEKTIQDLRKILNSRNINDHNIKIIVADDKCDVESNAEIGDSIFLGN